jgi:hypothetical protein
LDILVNVGGNAPVSPFRSTWSSVTRLSPANGTQQTPSHSQTELDSFSQARLPSVQFCTAVALANENSSARSDGWSLLRSHFRWASAHDQSDAPRVISGDKTSPRIASSCVVVPAAAIVALRASPGPAAASQQHDGSRGRARSSQPRAASHA